MSCYFRHIQDIFDEAGIKVTPDNKKEIDRTIHRIVNVPYKNCPGTWKELKNRIAGADRRAEFIRALKAANI